MLNLLKADFFRVIKDKMFMILSIICGAISVTIPIAMFGLFSFVTDGNVPLRDAYTALSVTDLIASPFSTFGLVLIVFLLVLLGKDNNTLRNKVIVGKSRAEIYFANAVLGYVGNFNCILEENTGLPNYFKIIQYGNDN